VHIHSSDDIRDAVAAGADGIEHTFVPRDPDDVSEAEDVADLMARTGTYFCPTLTVFEQIGRSGDRAYLDELVRDEIITPAAAREVAAGPGFGSAFPHHPADETLVRYRYGMRTLPIYRDAGVKIAAGSDVAFVMARPAALHRELQLLALAGLSGDGVIVAASRHAAEKIGKGKTVGTIAPGMVADALLVDADPRGDIMHLVRSQHRIATLRAGQLHAAVVA
jgi:imidazolonepropionase-like amidohydrolase